MTHTDLKITHIFEGSPRGFSNEVTLLPVTREYEKVAEESVAALNNDTNAWGELYEWELAPASMQQRAGMFLRDIGSARDLDEMLSEHFLSAIAYDPDAYDYLGGQWVSRSAP